METKVYKIFGKVLKADKPKVSFRKMNELSFKLGIFVPEELCYSWLYLLLEEENINPNSTFYQSWNDVASKTRIQLFFDQVKHYASTYGTNFTGEAWLPEHSQLPEFPYKELKVLEGITMAELMPEIQKLGYSNIAFSQEVLDFLLENKQCLEIDRIQNRNLKMMCIPDNYQFKNGQECLNWILWKWFNISMLVKNKETFNLICPKSNMLPVLTKNKEVLASVFYRNKDVFMQFKKWDVSMQFKKCKELCHIVNVIRKLAVKLHKPMKKSPWLELEKMNYSERMNLFKNASIFKLVQMYNALNNPSGYYIIRNGKAFYKESAVREVNNSLLTELFEVIVSKVPKVESVTLPKGIELAMPTSEKNFIGDIPLGSIIDCSEKNTMVGIYWKNKWGARDLDLHVRTIEGDSLGWNSNYYNNDIIFSGDMTDAEPEAAEVMWFKSNPTDSIVSVSEYSGSNCYHYEMFVAQEKAVNFERNYMVNPNNIIFKTDMKFENKRDVTLGFFRNGSFFFHNCNIGNSCIPSTFRIKILEHLVQCNYLPISEVLEYAGINVTDDSEIKLISKGDLINFFSGSTPTKEVPII